MVTRLVLGLVLGLLMARPRPVEPRVAPPSTPTVDREDPPPGAAMPAPMPDIELPGRPVPMPDIDRPGCTMPAPMPDIDRPRRPRHRPMPAPSVPPTPPPGFEGEWPPATERRGLPPTPPPGYVGTWPGENTDRSSRIQDLLDQIRELLKRDFFRNHAVGGVQTLRATDDDGPTISA